MSVFRVPRDYRPPAPPSRAIANPDFPYRSSVEQARRFLASRGITDIKPVYGRQQ